MQQVSFSHPFDAIAYGIRFRVAWLRTACETFRKDARAYLANLTESQRCNIFNVYMSVTGVGLKMPDNGKRGRQKRNVWDESRFTQGVALAHGRDIVVTPWVNQTYDPVIIPGKPLLPSLREWYEAGVKSGAISPPTDWETACKAEVGTKEKPGRLSQIPARGGYALAVTADLQAMEKSPAAQKRAAQSAAEIFALGTGETPNVAHAAPVAPVVPSNLTAEEQAALTALLAKSRGQSA